MGRRPGRWPPHSTQTWRRRTTRRRTGPLNRSSAGSPLTPPPGSGHGDGRCRSAWSGSRRSRCGTTPPAPGTRTGICTSRSTPGCSPTGKWRGLHTVGFRDSIEALNGIGHAAVISDPGFRAALASAGFTLDPASGEVAELAPYVGGFSERAAQISRNIDRYEAEWRRREPRPGARARGAANLGPAGLEGRPPRQDRPRRRGGDGRRPGSSSCTTLGYRDPSPQPGQPGLPFVIGAPRVGELGSRLGGRESCCSRLGARRSAWNVADIRGQVEKWIAATGLVADAAVRVELAEDLTARVVDACVPLLDPTGAPEHVRSLTSARVLGVEAEIVGTTCRPLPRRPVPPATSEVGVGEGLDEVQQRAAVAVLTGDARAGGGRGCGRGRQDHDVVGNERRPDRARSPDGGAHAHLEGGPGRSPRDRHGRRRQRGSVAWLVHQHGFRWDADGRWTRVESPPADRGAGGSGRSAARRRGRDARPGHRPGAAHRGRRDGRPGGAGRRPPPAPRRGPWGCPRPRRPLGRPRGARRHRPVHRFADPEYAAISLALRTGRTPTYVPGTVPGDSPVGRR